MAADNAEKYVLRNRAQTHDLYDMVTYMVALCQKVLEEL